ncbi:MAG: polysaccharide biosynthesis/export family protein [Gammaproteobacteria bacterium]
MLQQLPAGQREALLRSMGIDSRAVPGTDRLEFPQTVIPAQPDEEAELPEVGPVRLKPGDTVIVDLSVGPHETRPAPATAPDTTQPAEDDVRVRMEDEARLEALREEAESDFEEAVLRNPQLAEIQGPATYEITADGRLEFPGIASILVAGLTEEQAARRIEAEPSLRVFLARVTQLPLEPLGVEALEPFGYYLFKGAPVTFAPATDVPVPPEYVLGPGDELRVQLFGKENAEYRLVVDRDGTISFPEIGPIVLTGLSFADARRLVSQRVSEQMIGVQASVTMGELRSVRVFVLGDVNRPGSFTVSGLSTMTNALFVSGGVSPSGSMRNIQLKRNGRLVQRLDLYDLLLGGDNSDDARLMPNDVIFVAPRGRTVAVAGEVQRPSIYELADESTAEQVIQLAGGFSPQAMRSDVTLQRVDGDRGRSIRTLDMSRPEGRSASIRSGDAVSVGRIVEVLTEHVRLAGHVYNPGAYEWQPAVRPGAVREPAEAKGGPALCAHSPTGRPERAHRGVFRGPRHCSGAPRRTRRPSAAQPGRDHGV